VFRTFLYVLLYVFHVFHLGVAWKLLSCAICNGSWRVIELVVTLKLYALADVLQLFFASPDLSAGILILITLILIFVICRLYNRQMSLLSQLAVTVVIFNTLAC
jgi:hypothetical protein